MHISKNFIQVDTLFLQDMLHIEKTFMYIILVGRCICLLLSTINGKLLVV